MNEGMMLFGILWIITVIVFTLVKKAEQAVKEDELLTNKLLTLKDFAEVGVKWAQDHMWQEAGVDRRKAAVKALRQYRDMLGLDLTEDQLEALVSVAYKVMKNEEAEVYVVEQS